MSAILLPTHAATCFSDATLVPLVVGPFGRCSSCDVLTDWLTVEGDHLCVGCQADLDWSVPVPLADLSLADLDALEGAV